MRTWARAFVVCLATACTMRTAPPAGPSGPESPARGATTAAKVDDLVSGYDEAAARIVAAAVADRGAWEKLAHMTDRIGPRLSGSRALDKAIAWAVATMKADGHEAVQKQRVMVPRWIRGREAGSITAPISSKLHLLALGGSAGTPPGGLEADVLVVRDFDDLDAKARQVKGRIVLFDKAMPPFGPKGSGYGELAPYRVDGPARASRLGAVGALVRSITARSLRSPHTGVTIFQPTDRAIPAVAVSLEDADLIGRLAAAGERVRVRLQLGARTLPDVPSANVIAELRGRERPEEIVLIGAHLDSWDVGQGAHDDGAGCVIMMQALTTLRRLNLVPRRTIRVVLYTNEENGLRGATAYADERRDELGRHVAAFEADSGGFLPAGVSLQAAPDRAPVALRQLRGIARLLARLRPLRVGEGFAGADIMPLGPAGVPLIGLDTDEARYFDYHHSHADTLDKVDPGALAQNVAVVAVFAYVLADMPARLGAEAAVEPAESATAAAR